ncbi:MAG: hypothetical protein VR70_10755 [Rhodospirillaceae bacterium BRH_c57]|nr:MAG: hypothetical protein VR70_10755 [Rhodospirillaceae bacterium BRH_c57]
MGGLLRRAVASGRHRTIRDVIAENLADIAELRASGWPWGKIAKLLEDDSPMVGDIGGATVSRYCRMMGVAGGGVFPQKAVAETSPPLPRQTQRPFLNADPMSLASMPEREDAASPPPKRRPVSSERKPRGFDFSSYGEPKKSAGDDILAAAGIVVGEEIAITRTIGLPKQAARTAEVSVCLEVEAFPPQFEEESGHPETTDEISEEDPEETETTEAENVEEQGAVDELEDSSDFDEDEAHDDMGFEPPPEFDDDLPEGFAPPEVIGEEFLPPDEDERF